MIVLTAGDVAHVDPNHLQEATMSSSREPATTATEPRLTDETGVPDLCPCGSLIQWFQTVDGHDIALDEQPHPNGLVEIILVRGAWRADILVQVEALFDVGPRPRWRPHAATCSRVPRHPPARLRKLLR